jgi:hypothetical protein
MILSAHQPDLLPYTGFWWKMENADLFCVLPHEQINHDGYTRRVKMRGNWATLAVEERHTGQKISELCLRPDAGFLLWDAVRGRYSGSEHWAERHEMVREWIELAADSRRMWQFNLSLILSVRDYLGITTPVVLAPVAPDSMDATQKLVWLCELMNAETFLSGPGAKKYLTTEVNEESGAEQLRGPASLGLGDPWDMNPYIAWSTHEAWTGDSILSTVFDKDEPSEWVLNETELEGAER